MVSRLLLPGHLGRGPAAADLHGKGLKRCAQQAFHPLDANGLGRSPSSFSEGFGHPDHQEIRPRQRGRRGPKEAKGGSPPKGLKKKYEPQEAGA